MSISMRVPFPTPDGPQKTTGFGSDIVAFELTVYGLEYEELVVMVVVIFDLSHSINLLVSAD